MMKVSEAAKTSKMAVDMILVAVRDLRHAETTLEAALWFMGEDFGYWAEMANSPYLDPLRVFEAQLSPSRALVLMARIRRILIGYDVLPEESGYTKEDVKRLSEKVAKTLNAIASKESNKKKKAAYVRQATGDTHVNNRFIRLL